MPIDVNRLRQDFGQIARITATPGAGATRPTFTPEWAAARDYIAAEALEAGCTIWIDAFGNLHARPSSLDKNAKAWLCGSHIDTVPHGGDYDGVTGILVALELLRSANDEQLTLLLELVVFAEEEGPTFGLGMIGSRLWVGDVDEAKLSGLKNSAGQTYIEAGKPYGVDPTRFVAERFDGSRYVGLIEAHIEQGPGMWDRDQRLAVVRAIAGRRQYKVAVLGQANHAGATSMSDRRDALAGAAQIVTTLEEAIRALSPDAVVTVGRFNVQPNAVNVIADRVEFTIDFRAAEDETIALGDRRIRAAIEKITGARKLGVELTQTEAIAASPMSAKLVEALAGGQLPVTVSGALHDSAVLAPHVPTVMLFVPSRGGISHNPAEFSRVEDVAEAARLVGQTFLSVGPGVHSERRTGMSVPLSTPTLKALNDASKERFVKICGPFYEHSAWIAERAAEKRPFASLGELLSAMSHVVRQATPDEQLSLIRAHPDLVGRLARAGRLTRESTVEQAAAGLAALSPDEVRQFESYNAAYREKFGFPFIICARKNRKDAILAALPVRLNNTRDAEVLTALGQIDQIAELRARDAIIDS